MKKTIVPHRVRTRQELHGDLLAKLATASDLMLDVSKLVELLYPDAGLGRMYKNASTKLATAVVDFTQAELPEEERVANAGSA